MKILTWLSVYLLLLFNISALDTDEVEFTVVVSNDVTMDPDQRYSTFVPKGGILQGGLTRLESMQKGFTYTVKVHPDFGPYLLSVNGLFGQSTEKTYWQLLVKRLGHLESLTVGIGCFIPEPGDEVILKYTTYNHSPDDHEDL